MGHRMVRYNQGTGGRADIKTDQGQQDFVCGPGKEKVDIHALSFKRTSTHCHVVNEICHDSLVPYPCWDNCLSNTFCV